MWSWSLSSSARTVRSARRWPLTRRWPARTSVLSGIEDAASLAGVLGLAAFAVTMRLHAGILAAAAGTPAVILDYDPKVRAFAEQTGQAAFTVSVDDLESAAGEQALEAAATVTARDLGARRAALAARWPHCDEGAGRTARLAVQLASCGGVPGMPARGGSGAGRTW